MLDDTVFCDSVLATNVTQQECCCISWGWLGPLRDLSLPSLQLRSGARQAFFLSRTSVSSFGTGLGKRAPSWW